MRLLDDDNSLGNSGTSKMDPQATSKDGDTSPNTPSTPSRRVVIITEPPNDESPSSSKRKVTYYDAGNTDLARETPLTQTLMEPRRKLTRNSQRLVIALVGLPARGKSFVARKLEAYLNWSGAHCRIFNVGRYRRQAYADQQQELGSNSDHAAPNTNVNSNNVAGACDANFFDPNNTQASQLQEKVAGYALRDMMEWLDEDEGEDSSSPPESPQLPDLVSRQGSSASTKLKADYSSRIAIFDATNSTNKRRQWILEQCASPEIRGDKPVGVIFVESYCDDKKLLEENYRYKVSTSPDYEGMHETDALADLRKRVEKYERQYETIEDDSHSYIKIFNLSTKLLVNHIYGRIAKELVPALMAWHIGTRPVFLCRPGETYSGISTDGEDYVARRSIDSNDPRFADMCSRTRRRSMRGDSLGVRGIKFRQALLEYCREEVHSFMQRRKSVRDMADTGTSISGLAKGFSHDSADPTQCFGPNSPANNTVRSQGAEGFPLRVLTSTMPRAVDTVSWEEYPILINEMSNLNPLDKGDFAGMELEEMQATSQEWYGQLQRDAFDTRFPGGESYRDLLRRIASVVIDVEQQVIPTLVVSHVSILQCLIAYFRNTPIDKCMSIEVPMHTILKFEPVRGGGWSETRVPLLNMQPVESMGEMSQMTADSSAPIWSDHQILSASYSSGFAT